MEDVEAELSVDGNGEDVVLFRDAFEVNGEAFVELHVQGLPGVTDYYFLSPHTAQNTKVVVLSDLAREFPELRETLIAILQNIVVFR